MKAVGWRNHPLTQVAEAIEVFDCAGLRLELVALAHDPLCVTAARPEHGDEGGRFRALQSQLTTCFESHRVALPRGRLPHRFFLSPKKPSPKRAPPLIRLFASVS